VPSAYFLTDCYLYLDLLLKKKLFKPKAPKTRGELAGAEGAKSKKMIQALRNLWRSSPQGAHDQRLLDLKALMSPSPVRNIPIHLQHQHVPSMKNVLKLSSSKSLRVLFWGMSFCSLSPPNVPY